MGFWAETVLRGMGWEEKVGQLVWAYVGDRLGKVEEMAGEGRLGAVIVGPPDMPSPSEAARLTNRLQQASGRPLIVAADFEAGAGLVVEGATELPSNMAVGATGSPELAYLCGSITAREARAIGVNMVIAPVVDVNVNPLNPIINIRSYGGSPDLVSRLAAAFVRGCQENGAIAVAKHFPGHGDTHVDSHRSMPVVPHDMRRMEEVELKPYRAAIEAGVKAVMSAHIHFPALDPTPGLPATLSKRILTGLLRDAMGFRGLVVTDAMAMWAISKNFEMGEAAVMAVDAGVDLVLADDPEVTYAAILGAVKSGRIGMGRVEESVLRILEAKESLGLDGQRLVDPSRVTGLVGTPENRREARGVAVEAVTLVRGRLGALLEGKVVAVCAKAARYTGRSSTEYLAACIARSRPDIPVIQVEEDPTPAEGERVLSEAERFDAVLFATFPKVRAYREGSGGVPEGQVNLTESLEKPYVAVSYGSPYALARFRRAEALLCAYGDCDASIDASIDVLLRGTQPRGRLPVAIPGLE